MGEAALKISSLVNKAAATKFPVCPEAEQEKELIGMAAAFEAHAALITIENHEEYTNAANFGRRLKQASAKVTAFFMPMKKAASKAHREICGREKVVLLPLTKAETMLKRLMGDYALRKEGEHRAAEEAARNRAKEDAANQLADSMNRNITPTTPKVHGIRQTKDWEITSIDFTKVSLSISGIELRNPQTKGFYDMIQLAVLQHIRMAKGAVQIPGVVFCETYKTSIGK